MLSLWIFGDNVEDASATFATSRFYLLGGVAAAADADGGRPSFDIVPMVGASGAIAAVMGAYLSLYPRAPITVFNPVPLLWFFFGFFLRAAGLGRARSSSSVSI